MFCHFPIWCPGLGVVLDCCSVLCLLPYFATDCGTGPSYSASCESQTSGPSIPSLTLSTEPLCSSILPTSVKPVLRGHSKIAQKIGFQGRLSLNAGLKYCRMLQWEHSAILWTFIKLSFVIKAFVLSLSGCLIGFTVYYESSTLLIVIAF